MLAGFLTKFIWRMAAPASVGLALIAAPACARQANLIDHMQGFDAFLAEAEDEDADAVRDAYRRHIKAGDPALYIQFFGDLDSFSDAFLIHAVELMGENREAIRAFHALALEQIPEATARASEAFGVRLEDVPQHVIASMVQTTGQVRMQDGRAVIVYGVDTWGALEAILTPNLPRDMRPTITHELFHAYHWEANPFMAAASEGFLPPNADAPIWTNFWSEGLATCAVRHVYPDTDIAHLLAIEGLWESAEPLLAELAAELKPALDANDHDTNALWFFFSPGEDESDRPQRAGYVLGAAVAHLVVREHGLSRAAALQSDALRTVIDEALDAIAAGDTDITAGNLCQPGQ